MRLARVFGKTEVVPVPPMHAGGHGGADSAMRNLYFRNPEDPLGFHADVNAGAASSLLGIAGYHSIERGGEKVKISSLAHL